MSKPIPIDTCSSSDEEVAGTFGDITLTKFAGPRSVGAKHCYQLTGPNGYVQVTLIELQLIQLAIARDLEDA